jgi:hypothetical protein
MWLYSNRLFDREVGRGRERPVELESEAGAARPNWRQPLQLPIDHRPMIKTISHQAGRRRPALSGLLGGCLARHQRRLGS